MYAASKSSGRAWEICQFWQNLQRSGHPTVPSEYAALPGRKWKKGFFSIGSTWTAIGRPYTRLRNSPPTFLRARQRPELPLLIDAALGAQLAGDGRAVVDVRAIEAPGAGMAAAALAGCGGA